MRNFFTENRKVIIYIAALFLVTRLALAFIGSASRLVFSDRLDYGFTFSPSKVLDIWGLWDTAYYLDIASHGYSAEVGQSEMDRNQANYVFFPLYPTLIRGLGFITGDDYLAGLIISNLSLLVSAFLLYKIVRREEGEEAAFLSVKYLFLFPVAFILSGVFSESLFLALFLAAYYLALQGKWRESSVFGGLMAITRPVGIIVFPLSLFLYLRERNFSVKRIRWDIGWLIIAPLCLAGFMAYIQYLTGDLSTYLEVKKIGWGHELANPLAVFWGGLLSKDIFQFANAFIALVILVLAFLSAPGQKDKSYYYFAITLFAAMPLASGAVSLNSLLRYLLPIFPLYIMLARLAQRNRQLDEGLSAVLLLLQGFLMAIWVLKLHLVV